MIKKLDKYIFLRLLTITLFVLAVLIFIFVVIHYSDHSENFADNGATFSQIFKVYYPNYIPEIIRLVTPVAVLVACLFLTGQMADRLEITAIKGAGISLYRLLLPYLVFGLLTMCTISYLDGFVIPETNAKRIKFEHKYLDGQSSEPQTSNLYRQLSPTRLMKINYYDASENKGYRVDIITFSGDSIKTTISVQQMDWLPEKESWRFYDVNKRTFGIKGYVQQHFDSTATSLDILPRDLARTTTDIFQLTYPEAQNYIQSLQRSGASAIESAKVKLYGRLAYPVSILVVSIVGFALASVRRRAGKGFFITAGLLISFFYLAMMKIIQPFGGEGVMSPLMAVIIPHLFFFLVGIVLLVMARK